jgi:hypothetical protein
LVNAIHDGSWGNLSKVNKMQAEAGKGSAPRKNGNQESYSENHSKIFGESGPLARKKREEALQELTRLSEELGLYDEPSERDSRTD